VLQNLQLRKPSSRAVIQQLPWRSALGTPTSYILQIHTE